MPSLADEILEDSERRRRERRERFESSFSPVYAPEPIAAEVEHDPYGYIEDPVKRAAWKDTLATGSKKSLEQLAVEHPDWYQRGLTEAGNVDVPGMERNDRSQIMQDYAQAN